MDSQRCYSLRSLELLLQERARWIQNTVTWSIEQESWKLFSASARRKAPLPANMMMMSRTGTFYYRQEGLEPERQSTDEVDEGTSGVEWDQLRQIYFCIILPSFVKRKRKVLRTPFYGFDMEPGLNLQRSLLFTRSRVRDITGKLSSLQRLSGYYLLLVL